MAEKRPWGVSLNVALLVISGIIMVLATVGILLASSMAWLTSMIPIWITGMFAIVTLITLGISIAIFALAYFLWDGNSSAWWILIVLLGLGLVGNIISLISMASFPIVSLLIQTALLLGLLHKDTISFVNPGINWNGWELED